MLTECTEGKSKYNGRSVDLYINSSCNLGCATCFLGDDYFAADQAMTIAGARAILSWAAKQGVLDVAFLGGEPTLHPQLTMLLAAARELGIQTNRLVSNGTAPFRRLIESEHSQLIDRVHLSLDGATAEINDPIRGKGAFANIVKAIQLTARINIPTVINHTVNKLNVKHLPAMIEFAEQSTCEVLNIHWLSAMGRAADGRLSVSPEEWLTVCDTVNGYVSKRPDFTVECQAAFVPIDQGRSWVANVDKNACSVRSLENLQFMPDGRVYICGLLVDIPDINAFRWSGSGLVPSRAARTERTICVDHQGEGCPARLTMTRDLRYTEQNLIPVCIYERIKNRGD